MMLLVVKFRCYFLRSVLPKGQPVVFMLLRGRFGVALTRVKSGVVDESTMVNSFTLLPDELIKVKFGMDQYTMGSLLHTKFGPDW